MEETDLLVLPFSVRTDADGAMQSDWQSLLARIVPLLLAETVQKTERCRTTYFRLITMGTAHRSWMVSTNPFTKPQVMEFLEEQSVEARFVLTGEVGWSGDQAEIAVQMHNMSGDFPVMDVLKRFPLSGAVAALEELLGETLDGLSLELPAAERSRLRLASTRDAKAFLHYLRGRDCIEAHIHHVELENESAIFENLTEALLLDPGYAEAMEGLQFLAGEFVLSDESKHVELALRTLRRLLKRMPENGHLHALYASGCELLGHYPEAVKSWGKCTRHGPDIGVAWFRIGLCWETLEAYGTAAESFAKVPQEHEQYVEASIHRGVCLASDKRFDDAMAAWNDALVKDPNQGAAYAFLGKACHLQEQWERAENFFRVGMTAETPSEHLYRNYGRMLLDRERWQDAVAVCRRGLETFPLDSCILYFRGFALHHLRRDTEATRDLVTVLDLEGRGKLANLARKLLHWTHSAGFAKSYAQGRRACLSGDARDGLARIRAIIRSAPKNWGPRFYQGVAYRRLGQFGRARRAFFKVVELCPTHPEAFNELGMLCLERKDYEKSNEMLTRACELAPNHASYFCNLALLHIRWGKLDSATEILEHARLLSPHAPELSKLFNLLHRARGE